ncbi:hypothetical protein FQR65_LT15958 [Abscondita terminalis]|nr:hypothetical protein FQR65_LT15958 [Abscondita terminalis]
MLLFGCIVVSADASYSGFYYSIPQSLMYSSPFPYYHHPSQYFNPLVTYQTQTYAQPQSLEIDNQVEAKSIDSNTYHGFIYKTHLGKEATSNVFFLTGSNAHQREEIENFIASARNIMSNQITPKANVEKLPFEKMRPVAEITQEIFGNQPQGFHYIYNSGILPKGRSLNDSDSSEILKVDQSNEISTTTAKDNKETTTEKKPQTENPTVTTTTAESSTK